MLPTAVRSRSQYVPVARLARGGMAEIVLAHMGGARGFEKLVVLKRLLPHLAGQQRHVSMFLHEACVAARISHPNVCQVYELGEAAGHYNIVMEYLEGAALGPLTAALPALRDHFEVRLLAEIFRQLCAGLHHAHEARTAEGQPAGLVHRDVSPQNLLVTFDGVAKVLDFGIAKSSWSRTRTRTGIVLGKVGYLSPEQIECQPLDRRSDIFSLGVVLHEALTGQPLFRRGNSEATCAAVLACEVPDVRETQPHVPAALAEVLGHALAAERDDRPDSAAELSALLVAAVASIGGPLHTSEVAAWMTASFGDSLDERRRRVAAALAARDEAADEDLRTLPGVAFALDDAETGRADTHDTAPEPRGLAPGRVLFASPGILDERDPSTEQLPGVPSSFSGILPLPPPPEETESREIAPAHERPVRRSGPRILALTAALFLAPLLLAWGLSSPTPASPPPPVEPPPAPVEVAAPLVAPAAVATPVPPPPRPRPPAARPRPAPRPGTGWITLDSDPYGVVFVDGKRAGITPLVRHPVSAGIHRIRVELGDGRTQQFRLAVEAGKEAPRRRIDW